MSEDGDYMDGYNDGFIDGRGTMLKPLRWRTGPVPEGHEDAQFLIEAKEGYILAKGYAVLRREYWLPLSEILALVEE